MRLTSFTDYSLRVLIYLAVKGEESATISEIAQRYAISRNHLMKVVQELSQRGYLIASRGKNGGLRLGSDPADINLGELVRATESDFALTECFGNHNRCVLTPACVLQTRLGEALEAFFEVLDSYSLADLIPGNRHAQLAQILKVG